MQGWNAEESDDVVEIAPEGLDLDGFFEDDIAVSQPAGNPVGPAKPDLGLDDSLSYGSRVLNISSETTNGFDLAAGSQWIYPSNLPTRSYQYNIVQKALFTNTLVSLPTGLGKTFIAAVLMYNYYRWYPSGKVIFLAPTKPLVAQQVRACYNIMGIPKEHTTEMTGSLAPDKRVDEWRRKRVFFLTPQVMQNDLARGSCPADEVVCIVFDEAHKALGNHAYCQVIKGLVAINGQFRVLALTATPGDDLKAVQQVLTNLMISHIELRSEESLDIRPYVHQRKLEKVVVPLDGEIKEIKSCFLKILSAIINRLISCRAMYAIDPEKVSRFQLLQARDKFRSNPDLQGRVLSGSVEGDFALGISLYHAFELLQVHGIRSFYQTIRQLLDGPSSRGKNELTRDHHFAGILRRLHSKLEMDGVDSSRVDSRMALSQMYAHNVGTSFFYSHPKLRKLEEIILSHFNSDGSQASSSSVQTTFSSTGSLQRETASHGDDTRVMVFSQYRESVKEIATMLSRHSPLIRVMSFVGQATSGKSNKGLTQKEQLQVVHKFREGGYNTLVATCVGEEGLDIGDVDLIICFDAHNSPVRLIQRMGRTGRKRSGRIVVLVTEGKEERVYQQSQSSKKSIHKTIRDGCKSLQFYGNSYRMVPNHLRPQVCHLHMHVDQTESPKKALKGGAKGKQQSRLSFGIYQEHIPGTLMDAEVLVWKEQYALSERESEKLQKEISSCLKPSRQLLCLQQKSVQDDVDNAAECSSTTGMLNFSLDNQIEWLRAPVSVGYVGHSSRTKQLMNILQFTENIAVTEDFGLHYDMEMQTFLNPDDVVIPSSSSRQQSSEQEAITTTVTGRHKGGKRRLHFDSDDEDFVATSNNKRRPAARNDLDSSSNTTPSPAKKKQVTNMATNSTIDVLVEDEMLPRNNNVSLIPPPPDLDSLDWMDELPSQSPICTMTSAGPAPSKPSTGPVSYSTPVRTLKKSRIFPSAIGNSSHAPAPDLKSVAGGHSPLKLKKAKQQQSSPSRHAASPTLSCGATPVSKSSSQKRTLHLGTISPMDIGLPSGNLKMYLTLSSQGDRGSSTKPAASVALESPVKHTSHKPDSPLARKSPTTKSPIKKLTPTKDMVDTIPESDYEDEGTAVGTDEGDVGSKIEDDSFVAVHNKKRTNTGPDFLCTQLPPTASSKLSTRKRVDSSTDDDFTPVKKTIFAKQPSFNSDADDFLELEAEVSLDNITNDDDYVHEQSKNVYDVEDSFINDTTQLTQLPSKSPINMQAVYRQSLISPHNNMFGGDRTARGSKYRMAISRHHKLLHHFTKSAGIQITASDHSQHSSTLVGNDSLAGSEAEEDYLPLTPDVEGGRDDDFVEDNSVIASEKKMSKNKRAMLISPDSDCDVVKTPKVTLSPQRRITASPKKVTFSPLAQAAKASNSSASSKPVVVSPSLILTPPAGTDFTSGHLARFSFGMDEWVCPGPCDAKKMVVAGRGDLQNGRHQNLRSQSGKQHKRTRSSPVSNSSVTNKASSSHKSSDRSQPPTVLVDSKQISNPQVVSLLRQKHLLKVEVCPLGYVDYVISNRMVLQRVSVSELSNSTSARKVAAELNKVRDMYDNVSVLVEKDNAKKGDLSSAKMSHYDRSITQLCQAGVKLLFSQSPEETVSLITKLAQSEQSSGLAITVPVEISDTVKQKVHVLFTEPKMNYITALTLCHRYSNLQDIVNCSPEEIHTNVPFISFVRAVEICRFFQRQFNKDLV